jgi:RNA polymerase sigma factor (sigma-70 family)
MDKALTKEESDFAALHHGLVGRFLRKYGYPFDEFYDVVVFGYLDAVRDFFETEGLADKYAFSTLAFRNMRFRAFDCLRAKTGQKRKAIVLRYDEDAYSDIRLGAPGDPERILLEKEDERMLCGALGPRGTEVIRLKASGYSVREIGKRLGISTKRVSGEIGGVRRVARAYARETRDIAA